MKYFKKIVGDRIYLSPMNIDDLELYTKWMNDYEVSGNLLIYPQMVSLLTERKALEQLACEGQNFAIVRLEDDSLLGNISLMDINQLHRKAEAGLFIGEAENRGRGFGAEALRLILGYAFNTLNLHSIVLYVHADNEQALACYRKVGFREFGRRRDGIYKNGRYVDLVHMEILDTLFPA